MKLIKPKFEILESQGLFKDIEIAARTCYMSSDKIMEGSDEKIVKNLIERGHWAMLEHATVYLLMPSTTHFSGSIPFYLDNQYTKVVDCKIDDGYFYAITTNYRVLIEGQDNPFTDVWQDLEELQCEPTEFHEKRYSIRFTCDIGVSREFNRHRVDSIAEQSTRYCNFSKDQFGNEITCIQPDWVEDYEINEIDSFTTMLSDILNGTSAKTWNAVDYWLFGLYSSEFSYLGCLNNGWKAQQARDCLTLSTKTELIHTASITDWEHFFKLRDDKTAHPSARELAKPLHEEFIKLGYI